MNSRIAPQHSRSRVVPDAADEVSQLASLSRLTHLDLGRSDGVAALAPRLPALQSLALDLTADYRMASSAAVAAADA